MIRPRYKKIKNITRELIVTLFHGMQTFFVLIHCGNSRKLKNTEGRKLSGVVLRFTLQREREKNLKNGKRDKKFDLNKRII